MIKVACRAPWVVLKHPRRQGCRDIVVMTKQGHPVDVLLVKTTTSVTGVLPNGWHLRNGSPESQPHDAYTLLTSPSPDDFSSGACATHGLPA